MSITKAIAAQREKLQNKEDGFTLIELLVVVIIIGILAAIAIPVFLGQQTAAENAAKESDLATAKVAYVSNLADPDTPAAEFGFPASVSVISEDTTAGTFCLQTGAADEEWSVTEATAPAEGACD